MQRNELTRKSMTLSPTDIPGNYSVELPPAGFDMKTAPTAALLRHGIPPRPDPAQAPEQAKLWDRLAARKIRHVEPVLVPRPEIKRGPMPSNGQAALSSRVWSGGVLQTGGPFHTVYGGWTVPAVAPGASGNGDWWSVAWVGIDGWNSPDVLQAGTGQHVSRSGSTVTTEYFAWYEWFPNNWIEFSSKTMPVHPGDAVFAYVTYLGVSNGVPQGQANFTNITEGVSTSIVFDAPAGTTLQGNCAEWIMERPGINGVTANLTQYGNINFNDGAACPASGIINLTSATATNMTDTAGNALSDASLQQEWECTFVAAS